MGSPKRSGAAKCALAVLAAASWLAVSSPLAAEPNEPTRASQALDMAPAAGHAWDAAPQAVLPPADSRFESGRIALAPAEPRVIRLQIRGEYQTRFSALSDLPLRPHPFVPDSDTLGQTFRLQHWQRITPVLQLQQSLQLVAQADVPKGLIAGRENQYVGSAEQPLDERQPLWADFRWLFVEYLSPAARISLGQQPSHFGLGMVENDGDHPPVFGDYRGGNRVERLQIAVRPLGARSGWGIRVAADLVYRDPFADLTDDDVALRAVLATDYRTDNESFVALQGVARHQQRQDDQLVAAELSERLDWVTIDSAGRLRAPLPGMDGWLFAEYEVAARLGSATMLRTVAQQQADERERVEACAALARLGAAVTGRAAAGSWAQLVATLEWGWASGDADPYDGVWRRFDFSPNHNVGLIIFDEVLAWKTARAASLASDPALVGRADPNSRLLPSDGALFGATYVLPSLVWRPVRSFDIRAAAVLAQTTADLVDPTLVATTGEYVNYDGGSPANHDLGAELDGAVEYRFALPRAVQLQLGVQAAVFFPGNAFNDAASRHLPTQYLGMSRLGLLY